MIKILITTIHSLFPISQGGVVRVIEEVKFLKKNNFEVHLVGNKTRYSELKHLEKELGIHLYSLSWISYLSSSICGKFGLFKMGWFLNPFIRLDLERFVRKIEPEIIQAEFIYEGYQVSRICKKMKIPFILSEHNVESVLNPSLYNHEVKICNYANFVTTVSENDRNILEKMGVKTQIKIIPNGVDTKRFQCNVEKRGALREKFRIAPTDIVLVYHGTLAYTPNRVASQFLKYSLIPAIHKLDSRIKLLLIGPKHEYSVGEYIIELNEVPSDELPDYLSIADIAVIPLNSGSGTRLKILEYLSLGIPIVSTKIGIEGLPILDGEHAILTNGNAQEVISKIDQLISDLPLRERLIKNGKELVKEHYDWEMTFKNLLDIYNEVLDRH
jgi:polysaccharide biosynthesis protein PslH